MHTNALLTTFTIAAALGVCLFTIATHLRVSAIVILLIGGVLAGPQCFSLVDPHVLGHGLETIVSLSVAIILFEGGLSLDLKGYRSVSKEIWGILTVGVFVTWLSTAVLLRIVFGFDWPFCILAGSLIIVTGPTVIGPLLHRIRVKEKLHHILHWEGVLIDPIGVFIALLSFGFFVSVGDDHQLVVQNFVLRFAIGVVLGVAFGLTLDFVLRQKWVNEDHTNIFVLAMAMLNFGVADVLLSESGLLSVTVAGLVLGSRTSPQLKGIIRYKVELKDFLIGLLFVLLAANLDLGAFLDYGWRLILVVVVIMLAVRPLNVFASLGKSSLTVNEKLFLSWIAPRGIVAASMASVFTLRLHEDGIENAIFLETFAYSVIAGTVIVQGFSAGVVAHWLGVVQPLPSGWIIVGAHAVGRQVAKFLQRHGVDVVLVDTNARCVREAKREGFVAFTEDAMHLDPDEHEEFYQCGNLLALTSNTELNQILCRRWSELIEGATYRWEKTDAESTGNDGLHIGQRLWHTLPLSHWMHPDDHSIDLRLVQPADGQDPPDPNNIMLTWNGESVTPGSPAGVLPKDSEWLVYDADLMNAVESNLPLKPANVIFSDQTDLKQLYGEMLESLRGHNAQIDADELLRELWSHEEEFTSLVGHGIALPHVRVQDVDESIMVVARPEQQLVCQLTGEAIELVFMLFSPAEKHEEHLRHLASIAQLVGTQSRRERLLKSPDAKALYEAIMSR